MIDPNFYRYWSFWRRVLLFVAGLGALATQTLTVSDTQAQWIAFAVGAVNLALSLLPDSTVERYTPLSISPSRLKRRGDSGLVG